MRAAGIVWAMVAVAALVGLWRTGVVAARSPGPAVGAPGSPLVAVIDLPVSASLDDTAIRLDVTPVNLNADPLQRFGRSLVPYVDAWRFQNVTIPRGATIISATLRLTPAGWQTGVPIPVVLRGEAADHAANFADNQPLAHLRPYTTANVAWSLAYTPTAPFLTPNLAPVLQEIIGRPGWNSGQALALLATSVGASRAYVDLKSYDFGSEAAARLSISYQVASGTPTATPPVTATPSPTPTATATPGLNLGQALPLECWQPVSSTNSGPLSQIDRYACRPDWLESGPERVFALGLLAGEPLVAELVNLPPNADLDLFLLTGALPQTCQAYGDSGLSYTASSTGVVYLVVDGYNGAVAPFDLLARCPDRPVPTPTPRATGTPQPPPRQYLPFAPRA